MSDDANVRIGAWIARGGAGSDGFYIGENGLKGVFNGPGVRGDSVPRPQAHGDFDVPVFRSPRIVSIVGPCEGPSAERLDWYGNQLTGLLADGQAGQVIFDIPGGVRWGMGRLFDQPDFEPELWGSRYDWQLQLKFANPRLFGEARTFVAGEPAFHYGNFAATELITVTGNEPGGYTIYGPNGKQFIVTAPLVAGHPHTIDMSKGVGLLSVDGAYVMGGLGSRTDVWAIPSGAQVVATVSGSAALSRMVPDTFL